MIHVCLHVCVCVCPCVRVTQRKRESKKGNEIECVCLCVKNNELNLLFICLVMRFVYLVSSWGCLCVCVCVLVLKEPSILRLVSNPVCSGDVEATGCGCFLRVAAKCQTMCVSKYAPGKVKTMKERAYSFIPFYVVD